MLAAGATLGALLALRSLARERPDARRRPSAPPEAPGEGPGPQPAAARREPAPGAPASAPGEATIALASGVSVEAIEQDRPFACAGEPLKLAARVGGDAEPGALGRWLWRGDAGVELEPGVALSWQAPRTPGRYALRFQVCKDLGGRRVGVLAERDHEIEVRACDAADAGGPLRLRVTRLPGGAFAFEATLEGAEAPDEYTWDFDDGTALTTPGPRAEHAFAAPAPGPNDVRAYAVRVRTRPAAGPPLEATAFAVLRGHPPPRDAPPVTLDVARFRPSPAGGFESPLILLVPPGADITWGHLERVVQHWDDTTRSASLSLDEAVGVDERLERGGFRGAVRVGAADAGPEVKQVHDFLYGRDGAGREVLVSWTPFKREAPPPAPATP